MEPEKTARDRVMEATLDLFGREGIRAVGIDTIIARSGVAKMSLYRSFRSKDHLVVAYLEERNRRFFDWWERSIGDESDEPAARLRGLVAATVEKVRGPGYRGCPFLNTSAEFPDAAHPARAVIAAHKREVRSRLDDLCRRVGGPGAEALAVQLIVLMDGIYGYPGSVAAPEDAAAVNEAAAALIGRVATC
ncbi:TetR/AcrR family transcriptional regulator [Isosphaeraceae bacterium EP7]